MDVLYAMPIALLYGSCYELKQNINLGSLA